MKIDRARIEQMTGRKLLRIIRQRYPDLSDDQHLDRCYAALHEAGHFTIAVALHGCFGAWAYLAVPGRASKHGSKRGVSGAVQCSSNDDRHHALICAAGTIASMIIEDPIIEAAAYGDRDDFLNATERLDADQRRALRSEAIDLVMLHWETIRNVAKAMLLYAAKSGDINMKKLYAIHAYAHGRVRATAW